MRILVGKTFGIGNACLAVPMVKAIASLGHDVDVLVGSGPDDRGAREVFENLRTTSNCITSIWSDSVPLTVGQYDVAVMSIPFDGRWHNNVHFSAKVVLDGRARPDNVQRLGFDMWKKHEVEYQMDNARELGFKGETPDGSFLAFDQAPDLDYVYLGIGFKRDSGGFGASKHFGAERYARLISEISMLRNTAKFISTGSIIDQLEAVKILRESEAYYEPGFGKSNELTHAFRTISRCSAYLGNDTGMMHVAASIGIPTMGLFAYPDLLIKNPPFCARSRGLLFTADGPSIKEIAESFVDFVWGK